MKKRIALVTGVGKGIGKAIAERLMDEGYLVIGVDLDEESGKELQKEHKKNRFVFMKADISREDDVLLLFETLMKNYGCLDALVNNAGIIRDNMIWNMSLADFDKVINVNLRGTWLMCREAAKIMRERQSGRIVNIASRAWLGNRGQSNYSASKAGVVALTRVLALELGKYNVCVNAIAPGLIDTPLTRQLKEEVLDKLIEAQPTKSMGSPEDVAGAVVFLLSEQNRFITGQTIYVDGGKSIGAGI
jgi:NAD(P)-dependent dehydrogenase (short-subunit alcohol dehydrogenase family)